MPTSAGGYIEHAAEQYTLLGSGRAVSPDDFGNIVLTSKGGNARAAEGHRHGPHRAGAALRRPRCVTDRKTVSGDGDHAQRRERTASSLIERVKEKIASLRLPTGVKLVPFYDQAFVIDGTMRTVGEDLFEGFVLVTIILLLFLGQPAGGHHHGASVIPFSMLISFLGMRFFGISANLMSLGAIDFGMIVDGAVVMMENSVQRLDTAAPRAGVGLPTRFATRRMKWPGR